MNENPYPTETLDPDYDDGTMPGNVAELAKAVVGRRIVKTERRQVPWYPGDKRWTTDGFVITLDDGSEVRLKDTDDCCAFTELREFLLHPDKVDHVIMGWAPLRVTLVGTSTPIGAT